MDTRLGKVSEDEEEIMVEVRAGLGESIVLVVARWYYTGIACARAGKCFTVGMEARGFTSSFIVTAGDAGSVAVPSMME